MAKVVIEIKNKKKIYSVSDRVAKAIDLLVVNDDAKSWKVEKNSCSSCEDSIIGNVLDTIEALPVETMYKIDYIRLQDVRDLRNA